MFYVCRTALWVLDMCAMVQGPIVFTIGKNIPRIIPVIRETSLYAIYTVVFVIGQLLSAF